MRRLLIVVVFMLGLARAQDVIVQTLIPELLTLRTSSAPTGFLVDQTNYPPMSFPVRYPSTVRTISLYASTQKPWNLQMEVRDIVDRAGARLIPAQQIYFRVNGGAWIQATGGPQIIYSTVGPTPDWTDVILEYALELKGGEPGGTYDTNVYFTALVLP